MLQWATTIIHAVTPALLSCHRRLSPNWTPKHTHTKLCVGGCDGLQQSNNISWVPAGCEETQPFKFVGENSSLCLFPSSLSPSLIYESRSVPNLKKVSITHTHTHRCRRLFLLLSCFQSASGWSKPFSKLFAGEREELHFLNKTGTKSCLLFVFARLPSPVLLSMRLTHGWAAPVGSVSLNRHQEAHTLIHWSSLIQTEVKALTKAGLFG